MQLKITLKMDNEAFVIEGEDREPRKGVRSGHETARILRELADEFEESELEAGQRNNLRDFNGNSVGEARITR